MSPELAKKTITEANNISTKTRNEECGRLIRNLNGFETDDELISRLLVPMQHLVFADQPSLAAFQSLFLGNHTLTADFCVSQLVLC